MENVRRSKVAKALLPSTVQQVGMDRFPTQSAAQLLDTSMRVSNGDPIMSAVCDAIRVEERDAIENIVQAHRRRVTDGELRTVVGELVGVRNVAVRLMAWVDKGRNEIDKAARRQKGSVQ